MKIGGFVFPSDLIELNLGDLDVKGGMNWLSLYKANIDCEIQRGSVEKPFGKVDLL